MARDIERVERVQQALRREGLDGLVCSVPSHVLMLTGYWPVIGSSIALITRGGRIGLLVPEDEQDLAALGWADELRTFSTGSLDRRTTLVQSVQGPLGELVRDLVTGIGTIGYESGPLSVPVSYAGMQLYGEAIRGLVVSGGAGVSLRAADDLLKQLSAVKTAYEVERVERACRDAEVAFRTGVEDLQAGLLEPEAAGLFRFPLGTNDADPFERAEGFVYVMSGPNAARAYASFQRSRASRTLETGDLVLVHCNSAVDGYWTDITRTYCMGPPDEQQQRMYRAVMEARSAALEAIRPGVTGAEVDRAAREVMEAHGFGHEFKHPTGHGVGFTAIDHQAPPVLHPESEDRLVEGMVFNVEPGIYIEGYGGMRHCDMVLVTGEGARVMTPFHTTVEELTVLEG